MGNRHNACTQVTVTNTLILPEGNPDIERIISVTTNPVIVKSAVIDHKVIFSGCLDISVEYAGSVCNHTQPVYSSFFKIPFSHFINCRSARATQEAKLDSGIEFQEFHPLKHRQISALIIIKVCLVKLQTVKIRDLNNTGPAQFIPAETVHLPAPSSSASPITDTTYKPCSCMTFESPSTCSSNSVCCDFQVDSSNR